MTKIKSLKDVQKVVDAMWLLDRQSESKPIASDKLAVAAIAYLKRRKIFGCKLNGFLTISLPWANGMTGFNPYNSKRVLRC